DLEDFSDINDSYGHAFGNEVIQEVAERLREMPATLLVRSGGDEFILCFDHALSADSPELARLARVFEEPVRRAGNKVELSVRAGIANREGEMSSDEMVIYSDLATQHAKASGARRPVFYDKDMSVAMERKIEITSTLKSAISDESIVVVWQPQVDVETHEVYGYEALCRLADNAYYPSDFIPVAEMSGLVLPLDRIMTEKVVEQLAAWRAEGGPVGVASINFSAAQLRDHGYCDFLADLLKSYDVPASLIKIEITESMLIGNESLADELFGRLRDMGITLALDDFGTGYSSLARMAAMPVDFVKLDKSLVDAFMVPGKEEFIDHVTRLVHGLGKRLVVEGVETYEQYEICQRLGCDIIQGYFFSKPVMASDIPAFDPDAIVSAAKAAAGDKTRNPNWAKYARDSNGRWQKKSAK
ncbi:MAG: bifunctional diguanylate cyclase/phosphodiesterase, partial [Olsenella sp.]|nr:bifunctional diguanylate cyclase/phosphodiesterase [Olsenella sp.]